uniref:Nuclear nucleic acid-binding protein C1D n=1 Tax=Equus caballus TaxID=9796 RepID=A0A9L0RR75_HORSE
MTSRLIFICFQTLFGEEVFQMALHICYLSYCFQAFDPSSMAPNSPHWIRLVIMASEEINEDYPVEIHEYLSTFENSIGAVDEMLKTMMSVSRNELLQKLDPLEQAKVDLVSAYTLNSMFWVYLATQGVNPKEHPVKQELERIRVYMNRVKEITDKKKAGKLDRGAASRFVKNALWEPKPKNASKVANKGKSKN